MKKRVAALLAAMCALGVTAFAASPYDDVPSDHWAYQSVVALTEAGIIDGYPDGEFKGERNITRYEMAQMIARAMANSHLATPDQQAMINRLVSTYADDLRNIDVRLMDVEDRLEKMSFNGEAKVYYSMIGAPKIKNVGPRGHAPTRYAAKSVATERVDFPALGASLYENMPKNIDDGFYAKIRIGLDYQMREDTIASLSVTTSDYRLGEKDSVDFELDEAKITHHMNEWTFTGGRMMEQLGTGYYFGDTYDGVRAEYQKDNTRFTLGYGKFHNLYCGSLYDISQNFYNGELFATLDKAVGSDHTISNALNKLSDMMYLGDAPKAWYAQVAHEFKPGLELKAFYLDTTGNINYKGPITTLFNTIPPLQDYVEDVANAPFNFDYVQTYGLALTVPITDDFRLSGEWGQNRSNLGRVLNSLTNGKPPFENSYSDYGKSAQYWLTRLDFRGAELDKPGSYGVFVDYKDFDTGAYFGGTMTDYDDSYLALGAKFWTVGAEYVPIENLLLSAFYTFEGEFSGGAADNFVEPDDQLRVQLAYHF